MRRCSSKALLAKPSNHPKIWKLRGIVQIPPNFSGSDPDTQTTIVTLSGFLTILVDS